MSSLMLFQHWIGYDYACFACLCAMADRLVQDLDDELVKAKVMGLIGKELKTMETKDYLQNIPTLKTTAELDEVMRRVEKVGLPLLASCLPHFPISLFLTHPWAARWLKYITRAR